METATGLPAFTPTLAGVAPAQIATQVASDTPVPLPDGKNLCGHHLGYV